MARGTSTRESTLKKLNDTVANAVTFFTAADPDLFDGYQTAHEVLAHLTFWHREYVAVAQALLAGRQPDLKHGSYAELNLKAEEEFGQASMAALAEQLGELQSELDRLLQQMADWSIIFPIKHGGRFWRVGRRVRAVESHIRNHVSRLARAQRHGSDWVRAYFLEA